MGSPGCCRCSGWLRVWELDHNLPEGPCAFEMGPDVVTVHKESLEASYREKRGDSKGATEKAKANGGMWRGRGPHALHRLAYHRPGPCLLQTSGQHAWWFEPI